METKADKTPDDPEPFDSQIQSPELRAELIKLAARAAILPDDREDIVSDTISAAIRKRSEYDPGRASVVVWVLGIGKKVIATYLRKRRAKKRTPESGVISLNTSTSENGYTRCEPADAVAETNRRSSEEVQHYLDSAKLSEKEAKAIAHRLDKQSQKTGQKFSSSTDRRAMKKLKQIASDEKFQERPRGPEAAECAYGNLPPAEHDTALLYDAVRRISWFVEEIARWRNSPEWTYAQAFLADERAAKRFPLAILREHWPEPLFRYRQVVHERDPVLRRRFEAAVEIALAFPEWPRLGYCRLEPNERRERLEQFGWLFGPEPFWEIDERTFEFFVNATDKMPDPKFGLGTFLKSVNEAPQNASDTYSSVHLIWIDRRDSLKKFLASAEKWYRSKLKDRNSETVARSGRPWTARLVGFACIRLLEDFGLTKPEAMSWLKTNFRGPVPRTPERLERAARAAREALKGFLPSPTEIGV